MRISFHYLLHIADCIIDCGPCGNFWQYPMERLCGMLLPLIHSRLHPYQNLTNNILLAEKFNHLTFVSSLNDIFSKNSKLPKQYSLEKVYVLKNKCEELYWPSINYDLNVTEFGQLKHFYSSIYNTSKRKIKVCNYILKFYLICSILIFMFY